VDVQIAPPNTYGWSKSDLTFAQLGEKVGTEMKDLKGVYGEATLIADNGDVSGHVVTKIKIRSDKEFAIEYNLPADPAQTNRMLANPAKGRAMMESGDWKPIPKSMGGDIVEVWPYDFPKQIFSGLVTGQDTWKPFFEALAKGQGGYKATIEMRSVVPTGGGLPQKYYRISAVRTNPRPEEIEARFDAVHFLPLAIRVKTVQKNGKKLDTQWQARWTWTQPLTDADFVMPRAM
jgi:hypothetical protein